jgi:class 3 adenylate cyclase
MIRTLVGRGSGQIVNSTGDGFFAAFESPSAAVQTAIAIQRALRDHADSSGFAPSVRIGLHTALANQRGSDYSGIGIHVAARIAGLAAGREIVASADVVEEAGDVAATETRTAEIRGASAPVTVATIAWS